MFSSRIDTVVLQGRSNQETWTPALLLPFHPESGNAKEMQGHDLLMDQVGWQETNPGCLQDLQRREKLQMQRETMKTSENLMSVRLFDSRQSFCSLDSVFSSIKLNY
jgi:hypothetical protein